MASTRRHKVFVSFYSEDMDYRDKFVSMLDGYIVDRSVRDGDIDETLKVAEIRRQIRDDFIADATVTAVLIGPCTWRRKHVDWEIGASLTKTRHSARCGLLGILLPSHPNYGEDDYDQRLIPPRLARNSDGENCFAYIYNWTGNRTDLVAWIDRAFRRRKKYPPPDNSYELFAENRTTACSEGWQS